MKTIHKYKLKITDVQDIEMPHGSNIISAGLQGDDLCIWAIVDIEQPVRRCRILIFGTGQEIHGYSHIFRATVQCGNLVWHIFEQL